MEVIIPHLAPEEIDPPYDGVGQAVESNCMRPPRVIRRIRLLPYPLVPIVAISVECACAVTIEDNLVAAEDESRGLVLVANIE